MPMESVPAAPLNIDWVREHYRFAMPAVYSTVSENFNTVDLEYIYLYYVVPALKLK